MASELKGLFPMFYKEFLLFEHFAPDCPSAQTCTQPPAPAIGHVDQMGKKATGLVWGLLHRESGALGTRPRDTCLELPVTSSGTWGWPCLLCAALGVVTECVWKGQVSALCKAVMVPEGGALSLGSGGSPTRRWSEHSADTWEILDRAFQS